MTNKEKHWKSVNNKEKHGKYNENKYKQAKAMKNNQKYEQLTKHLITNLAKSPAKQKKTLNKPWPYLCTVCQQNCQTKKNSEQLGKKHWKTNTKKDKQRKTIKNKEIQKQWKYNEKNKTQQWKAIKTQKWNKHNTWSQVWPKVRPDPPPTKTKNNNEQLEKNSEK